ncbi:MAG: hypothetical protein H0T46_32260 [Deltaproteobacteria bacterium]|nr:hypothetical protein [Deltaproteobacteria bacterium]
MCALAAIDLRTACGAAARVGTPTLAIVLLLACGGATSFPVALKGATNKNVVAHDKARDELMLQANGAPFDPLVAVVELNQQALPAGGIVGLRPGEGLYALPDGELMLMTKSCIRGSSCGCEVSREYVYLKKPEGTVVVARLTPVVSLREIHIDRCGFGCGQPAPPALRTAARLGVKEVAAIKFVEATYPYELVVETCDDPVPRP